MKIPQHPNIALAIEALVNSNMDAAWHLLRVIPKETDVPVQVPVAKVWVGLTNDEREQHRDDWRSNIHDKEFRAIETKLKEKNT